MLNLYKGINVCTRGKENSDLLLTPEREISDETT